MSAKTRINRPTTATPRKMPPGRMIHQSTTYGPVKQPDGSVRTVQLAKGKTYLTKETTK